MTWADTNYHYKKQIVIDHTKVGATATDFPILLSITDPSLKTIGNGGHVQNINGWDIIFYDGTETTRLKHEIEAYVAASGLVVFWIKIPSLSSVSNTSIYAYYGNANVSSNPSTTDTWAGAGGYITVYHADESGNLTDSTSNGRTGTVNTGITQNTSGEIYYCQLFNGSTGKIDSGDWDNYTFSSGTSDVPFTLSMWIKPIYTLGTGAYLDFVTKDANTKREFTTDYYYKSGAGLQYIEFYVFDSVAYKYTTWTTLLSQSSWTHLVWTYDGAAGYAGLNLYLNGVLQTKRSSGTSGTYNYIKNFAQPLIFGTSGYGGTMYKGYMDEMRIIRGVQETASWVTTEYNNQSSPTTFLAIQGESAYYSVTINEQIGLIDVTLNQAGYARTVQEKVGLSDVTSAYKCGNSYSQTINELLGLLDGISKTPGKTYPELIGLADSVVKGTAKTNAELIDLLDGMTRGTNKFIPELLGLLDAISKATGKNIPELLGLLDSISQKATSKFIAELLGLSDAISKAAVLSRVINEIVGLFDSTTANKGGGIAYSQTINEIIGLLDGYMKTPSKTFPELIGLFDSMKAKDTSKTIPEVIGLLDATLKGTTKTIPELIGIKDTVATIGAYARTMNECIGLLDKNAYGYTLHDNELLGLLDSANAIKNYLVTNFGYGFDINVYY